MGKDNQQQFFEKNHVKEINLKDFFDVIKRRFWIIIVVTIFAMVGAHYYSGLNNTTPLYQTSTRIVVGSEGESMSTLMVMIKDPIILNRVIEELQLSKSASGIAGQIEVQRLEESQVIMISVTDSDPALAAAIANTTASVYKTEIANILDFKEVQLLSAAVENPYPINGGNQNKLLLIGGVFGLITGIGLVFLLDSLDGKIRKESELEEILGVPVLGVVSNMNRKKLAVKKSKQKDVELRGETVDLK
ncbi:hypothetical protein CIL05_02585 [Virgibacillus profundi]|uniref:Polysaccharide chain length determinant N-terminal domain-containing protein n=1 Tax=Virgibacillus profundi TaxID=2024555 RepID=A0A2A2IJ60_9BACI|nr:Wzz/FepE/Etk N-terminal domain-containing protein [Virgibacillus profundi]PAV31562.1 hypothetical protein CIL05_02585 [Virgibacillus profundi]PXY55748.1 capsular biosynthesis protein [Virgibacillus profundi]